MSQLPTVSVVIPTRRRPAMVDGLVLRLLLDTATTEVIIAVDGQEIGDVVLDRWRRLDSRVAAVRVKDSPQVVYGERQRDGVVHLARGEVILALDDDVVPWPALASRHARWHMGSERLLVLGYMPVSPIGGRDLTGTARFYSESYERSCRGFEADPETILTSLWGGNYSLRRKDWLASLNVPRVDVGYHADLEFGLRLRTLGLRGVFDPGLRADHSYRRTLREVETGAGSAGVARARLEAAYPELGQPRLRPTRRVARVAEAVTKSKRGWAGASAGLRSLAAIGGAAHASRLEQAAIRVLWRLAFDRAHRLAATGEPVAAP